MGGWVAAAVLVVITLAGTATLVGVVAGVENPFALLSRATTTSRPARVDIPPPPPGTVPTRVSIPSLAVSSSLIASGLAPNGEIAVPPLSTPQQAAWFNQGPVPSAPGAAVILGHINGDGRPGVFNHLRLLRTGSQVFVDRSDHQTAVFTVSRVDIVPKGAFPAEWVYGTDGSQQLRLITCGGKLDPRAHQYDSNIVAYASLTAVRPT